MMRKINMKSFGDESFSFIHVSNAWGKYTCWIYVRRENFKRRGEHDVDNKTVKELNR